MIERLLAMLEQGQDNALLRFSLGQAYRKRSQPELALEHLRVALALKHDYSAAWSALGQALGEVGQTAEALAAFDQGIEVAERNGDKQAERQMQVLRQRLQRV